MEIFKLFGSILIDSAEAENSISKTGEKAEGMGSKLASGIKTAAKWGTAVVGAATAIGGAMLAAAKGTSESLDVIDKGAQRMKISAESYQELAYAAGMSGVEMSTLEKAAKKLEGTDLNLDDALNEIMALGTAEERSAAAAELFGESVAYSMTPLLNAGSEGMAAMRQEANDLGLVMSGDAVAAGATMNDMFAKVESSISALKTGLVTDLMPYVMEILQWVIDNIPMIRETVGSVMEAIMPIVKTVLDFVMDALPPLLAAIKKFLDWILPYVKPVLEAVGGFLKGIFALFEGDVGTFTESVKNLLITLGDSLFGIGVDIMNSLWDGVKSIWESISGWFSEKASWIADKLSFWRSSKNEMESDGQHASGLPYVPYDGYVAELHRGETVLSAGQSQNLVDDIVSRIGGSGNNRPIQITVPLSIDGRVFSRVMYTYDGKEGDRRGPNMLAGGAAV